MSSYVSLESVLRSLEESHNISFFYKSHLIDDKKVHQSVLSSGRLSEDFADILAGFGLTYDQHTDRTYLILEKEEPTPGSLSEAVFQETISGQVVDASTGEALPGVNIVVEGTTTGTATDGDGNFSLTVPSLNETLVISFIGYQVQEQPINGQTTLDIQLEPASISLEEMVVVGYGVQDSRDVTGSIASVNVEQMSQRSPTNVFEAMQGQMSGVQITTNSGAPGEGAQVRIRGVSTFSGGVEPLYIVDGQPVDNIDSINPNDIASIEVLKDGASAAIYGSRSANGVVLITTKRPDTGELNINTSYIRSYSTTRTMPVLTSNQRYEWEQFRGVLGHLEEDSRNHLFYYNNNFQEMMHRVAQKDDINISISSGTENTRLYWNTGFLNEEGVIKTTSFRRINTTLNAEHDFHERISVGLKTSLSYNDKNNIDPSIESELIGQNLTKPPWGAIYNPDGSYIARTNSYRGRPNPVMEYDLMKLKRRNFRGNAFSFVELGLLDNLNLRSNIGVDFNFIRNEDFFPAQIRGENNNIEATFESGLAWNWINETYLNFNDEFNEDHTVSGVAGFSAQEWGFPQEQITGHLGNDLIPTLSNASEIFLTDTYTLDNANHSLLSLFGRISYSYQGKYLLSGTFRRDGSSRFGPDNRWGNFPAISAGWRFGEEAFMNGLTFINDAKVRAGYAITGNERIGNRDYDTQLTLGNFYNGIGGIGLSSNLGNPAIKWEETKQYNIGLDLSVLEGQVNFTADYYVKNTSDLLASQSLPAETGLNTIRVNAGDVQNRGLEFSIQATPYNRNDFMWSTSFNISTNVNEVKRLAGGTPLISNSHITREGDPVGSFYGYEVTNVFAYDESNAFTDNGEQLTPNFDSAGNFTNYSLNGEGYSGNVNRKTVGGTVVGGGDYNYTDLDGNLSIDGEDRMILGNPYPKYFGGFRNEFAYRGFNFSFLFDFQFEAQVYNTFYNTASRFNQNSLTPPPYVFENRWTGPGDETAIFPGGPNRAQNTLETRSHWVEDADFIKLRNVRLSYEIPFTLINQIGISRLVVFGSVNEALTWTNYKGFDPEVTASSGNPLNAGVDNMRYPRSRQFIFGINLNI